MNLSAFKAPKVKVTDGLAKVLNVLYGKNVPAKIYDSVEDYLKAEEAECEEKLS